MVASRSDALDTLKGAFIEIMPLTWGSFLLPVMDRHPLAHDLTSSTSGCGKARHPRLECLRLKNPALKRVSGMLEPLRRCALRTKTDS
jgi:hypothetical protein